MSGSIIILSQDTMNCIRKKVCPFCKANTDIENTLKVGYNTIRREFKYYVLWFEITKKANDYSIKIPICNSCKIKFHNKKLLKPSHQVLEHRQGYNMGLTDPLNFYNIEPLNPVQYESEKVKSKICPNCKLNNPISTIVCDCGYNFQARRV